MSTTASDPRFAKLDQDALEAKRAQVIGQRRPSLLEDAEYAWKLQEEESRRAGASASGQRGQRPRAGSGNQLGGSGADQGLSQEDVRQRQIDAAERRQASVPGVSREKAKELKERQQKDELLGKLSEHYSKKKMELPMGLNAATAVQLRKHWETVRSGDATAAVLGN